MTENCVIKDYTFPGGLDPENIVLLKYSSLCQDMLYFLQNN